MFVPSLHILPRSQQLLWGELNQVPSEFVLYGGTAIALHLGHRESVDFDFFGNKDFNPAHLYANIPFLTGALVLQQSHNTLTCSVERGGPVKVSFFGLPSLRRVEAPLAVPENGLRVASLIDLAGMKAAVVQQRAEAKDYVDLDALLDHGIELPLALAAARAIYGPTYSALITLKALCYFDDGNLRALPDELKRRMARAVAAVDLDGLPTLTGRDAE